MNILELCLSSGLGGLELYAFRSSLALSTRHQVISVIATNGKLTQRYAERPELACIQLPYRRSYLPVLNALRLARIIDQHKIDVIHMHWGKDLALAALARIFSSTKPALAYTRQMKITRSKNDFYHRLLYRQMDLMLCITKLLAIEAKTFISYRAEHIHTLYYGVSAPARILSTAEILQQREQHGLEAGDFIVGLFGRLEDGKGQHLLIKAIATAKSHGQTITALIVGHEMLPGYTDQLKMLAVELAVSEQVHFSGFSDTPQLLMQICDCVALTSYEETFGLVLAEAMRAGVAVIGSNAGGVPEIIEHGSSGLLFQPREPDSLCAQLEHLNTDSDYKHKLAAAGKTRADNIFSQDDHFTKLEQHLLSLINSNMPS